ncbi:alpha/beta hydrolase [Aquisalimonas lutea]|uniref:alpha/beta hydrolase n=1 Tax=Aquisalimonas lutea TaxID=1327750 RepID=UPI0025B36BFB|nr:alpha/beta hydrolase [Aquisalimonas lutea]MDN3517031.1 alpha/beta hydrolase [Aquisalimonas lutea]
MRSGSTRCCRNTTPWYLAVLLVVVVLPGCALFDAREQLAQMDAACVISGTVAGADNQPGPYVVSVFLEHPAAGSVAPIPVDYVITAGRSEWFFALEPGTYGLLAFRDTDGDRRLGEHEAFTYVGGRESVDCPESTHREGLGLMVGAEPERGGWNTPDLPVLDRESSGATSVSLGQLTTFGDVVSLDDPRFAADVARGSLWRPVDFLLAGHAGVYFLEPYDPGRTPVLFIHGINGSPRVFADIVAALDRERFQPWFYYYPSGISLQASAGYLAQIMGELEVVHDVDTVHVVAHSMGGLIGQSYLRQRTRRHSDAAVPRFITIATPWDGHAAAQRGVEHSPVVIPVWRDMARGSTFLSDIFADGHPVVAGATELHLLFTYRGEGGHGRPANDGVVTLASMLKPEAQRHATSVVGIDATHAGVLAHARAIDAINALLADHSR